jgi:aspartate/tyrosine/aromatic aminotransferase
MFIPKPTWGNHRTLLNFSGLKYSDYPYYDIKTKAIDFEGMCQKMNEIP